MEQVANSEKLEKERADLCDHVSARHIRQSISSSGDFHLPYPDHWFAHVKCPVCRHLLKEESRFTGVIKIPLRSLQETVRSDSLV